MTTAETAKALPFRGQVSFDARAQLGQREIATLVTVPSLEQLGETFSEFGLRDRGVLVTIEQL